MRAATTGLLALSVTFAGCAALAPAPTSPTPSILVDLDPATADRTVIVESITADRNGLLYPVSYTHLTLPTNREV